MVEHDGNRTHNLRLAYALAVCLPKPLQPHELLTRLVEPPRVQLGPLECETSMPRLNNLAPFDMVTPVGFEPTKLYSLNVATLP